MEIKHIKCDKASFITFEDIFDCQELQSIWKEAEFLCDRNKLGSALETKSATDDDGTPRKRNNGVWFLSVYKDIRYSNYLQLYKKSWNSLNNEKQKLIDNDINLKLFFTANYNETLLSYYENDDYYKSHTDKCCYTYVFWLFKEPKRFFGGDLTFPELNYTVNIKSNMGVLFPSWLNHEVDKIEMYDKMDTFNSNGRFCFSTFFHIVG